MCDPVLQPVSSGDTTVYMENVTRLTEIFFNRGGIKELVKAASSVLDNPIVMLDTAYKLIAHYARSPVDESFWEYLVTYGHASEEQIMLFETKNIMRSCYDSDGPVMINGIKGKFTPSLICKIMVNRNIVGGFGVIETNKPISETDIKLVGLISRMLGEELGRSENFHPSEGLIYEQFLYDLLDMTPENRPLLEERLRVLDCRPNYSYHVFSIPLDPSQCVSADYMRRQIREMFPQCHTLFYREKRLILIITDTRNEQFSLFLETLTAFLRKRKLCCGVSESFSNLIDFQINAHCAKCALDVGKKLQPDKIIYPFDDYRIRSFFLEADTCFNIKSYINPCLHKLLEYDRQNGTRLFQSLYAYLLNKGNIKLAAKQLFIHRNTLDYRMGKIAEITGWNLNDNSTFFELLFSCELLEFLHLNES